METKHAHGKKYIMCFHLPNAHRTTFSLAERTEQRTCLKPNHKTMMAQGRLQQPLLDAGVYYMKKAFPHLC